MACPHVEHRASHRTICGIVSKMATLSLFLIRGFCVIEAANTALNALTTSSRRYPPASCLDGSCRMRFPGAVFPPNSTPPYPWLHQALEGCSNMELRGLPGIPNWSPVEGVDS